MDMIPKVLAYIIRPGPVDQEVLVFRHRDHPEAGVQVPGGTIDEGELPVDALHREILEETGLRSLRVVKMVAREAFHATWRNEWQERHVFHVEAPVECPDAWTHKVTSGLEDAGLVFTFSWMPISEATEILQWGQGLWLTKL